MMNEDDEMDELDIPRRPARLALGDEPNALWRAIKIGDRWAEVVLLLPRPGGRLVTLTKPDYPGPIYRLPTGGVAPGELVPAAAAREAFEETGLALRPERILGVVDWTLVCGGREQSFSSFLCLFPPSSAPLHPTEPEEQISGFREVPWRQLSAVAAALHGVPPDWRVWGEQRALPHELALERLIAFSTPSLP